MQKLRLLLVALAMAPSLARADQPVPGRWFQLSSSFGSNPCAAGVACIYRNVNTLHFVDTTGADTALGAGGGSLGNYTASGNNLDVSVSGAAAIFGGNTNATSLTVGNASAMGPVLFNGGRLRMQQRAQSGAGLQAFSVIGGGATSLTASTEYINVNFQGNQTYQFAAGTVAAERFYLFQAPTITGVAATANFTNIATLAIDAAPTAGTNAAFTSAWALWLQTGNLGFGPNASIGQSSAAATNTTAFSVNCNVADGASSVCFAEKNSAATTSAVLHAWQTSTGVIEGQVELDTIIAGSFVLRQPSSTYMGFFDSGNNGFKIQSGQTYFRAAGADQIMVQSGDISPVSPGFDNLGVANYWATTKSRHYAGGGTAPTKAAGACIGGTQTVTLDGTASDATGAITLTGTATGTASATCATVTFNTAYATAPHCLIVPVNAAASALSGAAALFVDSGSTTTSVFVIKSGATALVAGTYLYTYYCMQ